MISRSGLTASVFVLSCSLQTITLAQISVDEYIQAIEGVQLQPNEGLGNLTVEELLVELNVPGVSIAIINDFDIHWAKAYGIADTQTEKLVDTETKFQAASISKAVNTIALLKAAQDGLINLDDDINNYLKSWSVPRSEYTRHSPVTARMLASHTSGLGDGLGFPGYAPGDRIPTLVQILNGENPSNTGAVRMVRPPATAYHYSGGGTTILQLALIDIYGKPYEEILEQNVLEPLGMADSTFAQLLQSEENHNAARAHQHPAATELYKWRMYPELAAAGLWTTPTDLAKLLIDTQLSHRGESNRVLSVDSVQQMLSPVGIGPYAMGYTITKNGEGWYFGHGGSNYGFRANMAAHKLKGYGYVIMTNSSRGLPLITEISRRIQLAYSWDSIDQPVQR